MYSTFYSLLVTHSSIEFHSYLHFFDLCSRTKSLSLLNRRASSPSQALYFLSFQSKNIVAHQAKLSQKGQLFTIFSYRSPSTWPNHQLSHPPQTHLLPHSGNAMNARMRVPSSTKIRRNVLNAATKCAIFARKTTTSHRRSAQQKQHDYASTPPEQPGG